MNRKFSFLESIPGDAGNLIKGLQLIQAAEGFVSNEAVRAAAEYFAVSSGEIEDVLRFYSQFRRERPGRHQISVCDGTACRRKGAGKIMEWLRLELNLHPGGTDAEGIFSLQTVACLGRCRLAPAMRVDDRIYTGLDRSKMAKILKEYAEK